MATSTFAARAALLILALLAPASSSAQAIPGTGPGLIEPADLMSRMEAGGTVVLHVGGSEEGWAAGHIPGSRYLPVNAFTRSEGAYGEPGSIQMNLPFDLGDARDAFEQLGVTDATEMIVVAYPAARQFTLGTRAVWTLEVLGLGDRTFLLNGGQEGWVAAGGEVEVRPEDARTFTAFEPSGAPAITRQPRPERVVDMGWMTQQLGAEELQVIDARSPAAYSGEREEFPGRAGHIPGAGSLPIELLLEDNGRFVGADRVVELLRAAGVQEGDRVITYCHIGQRASAAWFAAMLAGFDAAIYDGSMNEWGRTTLPLETGNR